MALRCHTVVIDSRDIAALARWWAETLDWTIVYESETEVVVLTADYEERAPTWSQSPPGLVFVPVPEGKTVKNPLHLDLAPHTSDDRDAEIARLVERGGAVVDVGQPEDASFIVLTDPEGNECCVLSSRDE